MSHRLNRRIKKLECLLMVKKHILILDHREPTGKELEEYEVILIEDIPQCELCELCQFNSNLGVCTKNIDLFKDCFQEDGFLKEDNQLLNRILIDNLAINKIINDKDYLSVCPSFVEVPKINNAEGD